MEIGQKVRLLTMDELIVKGCYLNDVGDLYCDNFAYDSFLLTENEFKYCGKVGTIIEIDCDNEITVKFDDGKVLCALSVEALRPYRLPNGTLVQLKDFDTLVNDENYYLDEDDDLVSRETGLMLLAREFKYCGKVGKVSGFDDGAYIVDFDGFLIECIDGSALIVIDDVNQLNKKITELTEENQKLTETIAELNEQLKEYESLSLRENNQNVIENLAQGQYLSIDERIVIVAQVDYDKLSLISLDNGNRWYAPRSIEDLKSQLHGDYVKQLDGKLRRLSNDEVIEFLNEIL